MLAHHVRGAVTIDSVDDDLGPYLFLREHTTGSNEHVVRRALKRAVPRSLLPDRAKLLHTVDSGECFDLLAEIDDVVVLLRSWRSAGDAWATAADGAKARAAIDEICARMPAVKDDHRLEVCFTDGETSNRYLKIDARPWNEIRRLYTDDVGRAMDCLVAHRPVEREARRLLLWHGPAGTGKTSAIRALLLAWRDWASAVIVTDPVALLSSGRYLRRTVLSEQDDERWQVLVLEDAEALLRKGTGGPGIGRLLNLADGLLGQGLRCMFLITTNDSLGAIQPAVIRPGNDARCERYDGLSPGVPFTPSMTVGQPSMPPSPCWPPSPW